MIINKISIKNLKSFGNEKQEIELTNEGSLILLSGRNGAGKCVHPTTNINTELDIYKINYTDKTINYLVETEVGRKILLYIKEKDFDLYESIINRTEQKSIK